MRSGESPYGSLAAILSSRKVGLRHIGLVGEVVVAQARLDGWLGGRGKTALPAGDWMEIGERVAAAEDEYRRAWQQVDGADAIDEAVLGNLEDALRATAELMRETYDELVAMYGQ